MIKCCLLREPSTTTWTSLASMPPSSLVRLLYLLVDNILRKLDLKLIQAIEQFDGYADDDLTQCTGAQSRRF